MADFGKLNFSTSLNPTSAFPLDARCYFESLASAKAAAATAEPVGSSNTVYHYGMTLTVYENGEISQWIIMPNGTLSQVSLSVTLSLDEYFELEASGGLTSGIFYVIEGDEA